MKRDLELNTLLLLLLLVSLLLSLMIGQADINLSQLFSGLFSGRDDDPYRIIVQDIRLPRIITGVLVGGTLGLSGAALQGLLRNPLADPGVIGVSASAGLGAVLAIQYGLAALSAFFVPAMAMLGACLCTIALVLLARRDSSVLTLILIGVGLNALAGALTSLAINFSQNPFALSEMVLWLLGALTNRSLTDVLLALPFMVIGGAFLFAAGPALRLLTLGEDVAQVSGVNLKLTRLLCIIGSGLSVGAAVAVAGMVGFVGLIVPHIIRPWVGFDPQRLLFPSMISGALLVLWADILVRLLPTTAELKLGVVTALIGGPFFLYLVVKTRRGMR